MDPENDKIVEKKDEKLDLKMRRILPEASWSTGIKKPLDPVTSHATAEGLCRSLPKFYICHIECLSTPASIKYRLKYN